LCFIPNNSANTSRLNDDYFSAVAFPITLTSQSIYQAELRLLAQVGILLDLTGTQRLSGAPSPVPLTALLSMGGNVWY